jgi:hypothetical protein
MVGMREDRGDENELLNLREGPTDIGRGPRLRVGHFGLNWSRCNFRLRIVELQWTDGGTYIGRGDGVTEFGTGLGVGRFGLNGPYSFFTFQKFYFFFQNFLSNQILQYMLGRLNIDKK